jgi:hypothetical protein
VCKDTLPFLVNGECFAKCPNYMPYYKSNILIWQKKKWPAPYCLPQCPLGSYPDGITNECLSCNMDCQTCNR